MIAETKSKYEAPQMVIITICVEQPICSSSSADDFNGIDDMPLIDEW